MLRHIDIRQVLIILQMTHSHSKDCCLHSLQLSFMLLMHFQQLVIWTLVSQSDPQLDSWQW